MPNTDKTKARGRLSQPCATQTPRAKLPVTPAGQQKRPSTKGVESLDWSVHESEVVSKLIERFDRLETMLDTNKKSSDDTASQLHKELCDIKAILETNRVEQKRNHVRLLIVESDLKMAKIKNAELTQKLIDIENQSKLHNIRLDGKPEQDGEDLNKFVHDLAMSLNPKSQRGPTLTAVYRIGKRPNQMNVPNGGTRAARPRTIMIVFASTSDRNTFYFARMGLKDIQDYRGIYLNDDVSTDTRKAREDFRSVASLARSEGVTVRVHDDGLILNGTKYKLNEPHSLPARFSLAKAKTVKINEKIYFHSVHSFLSNFYMVPIIDKGTIYTSAEQRYQAEKCEIIGDLLSRDKVLMSLTPLDAKRVGDTVVETAEWRQVKEEVMTKVVDLKFDQNQDLAKLLMGTGKTTLNEATNNKFFGIGATLHSRLIRDESYQGLNKLGLILMNKRQQLVEESQQQ